MQNLRRRKNRLGNILLINKCLKHFNLGKPVKPRPKTKLQFFNLILNQSKTPCNKNNKWTANLGRFMERNRSAATAKCGIWWIARQVMGKAMYTSAGRCTWINTFSLQVQHSSQPRAFQQSLRMWMCWSKDICRSHSSTTAHLWLRGLFSTYFCFVYVCSCRFNKCVCNGRSNATTHCEAPCVCVGNPRPAESSCRRHFDKFPIAAAMLRTASYLRLGLQQRHVLTLLFRVSCRNAVLCTPADMHIAMCATVFTFVLRCIHLMSS